MRNRNVLASSTDKLAQAIVDRDPVEFEKALLKAIDGSKEFYDRVASTLCCTETGEFMEDFSVPGHNALFLALKNYYTIRVSVSGANISRTTLLPLLGNICETSVGVALLGPDELEDAAAYMINEIQSRELGDAVVIAAEGFSYWLKKSRLRQVMNSEMAKTNWSPDDLLANAAKHAYAVEKASSRKSTKATFGQGRLEKTYDIQRFSSGLPALDAGLGGGFGKTEHTLWIAPSGAGKTVMACQLAVTFVRQGLRGVLISTEQPSSELEPRIYSAFCDILFDRIKDGIDEKKLTHEELRKVERLDEDLRDKLLFENWMHDRSLSVTNNLPRICQEYVQEYGSLDFVILDWIGGGLGNLAAQEPEFLRHYLQQTANAMGDIARAYNLMTHSFVQPNPRRSVNQPNVNATMMAECTTMHTGATTVLGISALHNRNTEARETYDVSQQIHCSKSRKSLPQNVRILREFEYQRFKSAW